MYDDRFQMAPQNILDPQEEMQFYARKATLDCHYIFYMKLVFNGLQMRRPLIQCQRPCQDREQHQSPNDVSPETGR